MQKHESSNMNRGVIAIAVLTAFGMWAPLFAVPPMEGILSRALSLTHFQAGILFSGPILMLALAAIPAGLLSDVIGVKKTAGIGLILIFTGAFSLVYGAGMGFIFPNLPKLAMLYAPPGQTFIVLGILNGVGLMGGISFSLAFTISPLYLVFNSYQLVFLIWSLPALLAAILWWRFVRDPQLPAEGGKKVSAKLHLITALLKNRIIWLLAMLLFLHNYFFYSWSGWMPSYMVQKGLDEGAAGLMTSVIVWVGMTTIIAISLISTRVRMPRKPLLWLPSLVFSLCSAAMFFVTPFTAWFIMALIGLLNILRFNTLLTLPVELLPTEVSGTASGLVLAVGYLGAVSGPLISGRILDISGDFGIIFWVLIFVSLATMLLAFIVPTAHPGKKTY